MALWKREKVDKFQRTDQQDYFTLGKKKEWNKILQITSALVSLAVGKRKRHPASFDIPFVLPNLLQHKVKQ